MPKSKYNRYSLEENQLKKVLIRIDYSGVTTIEKWIEEIKFSFIKDYFGKYFKRIQNNAKIDLSRIEDISQSLSIPVSDIIKEPVHTFTDSKFKEREDRVQLDITGFYLALTIDCEKYKNIDLYVEFISALMKRLLDSDSYIQIKRIGIRKIGGTEFNSTDEIDDIYEKESVFCKLIDKTDVKIADREYTDRFLKGKDVKINYTRLCRWIKVSGNEKFQVILDMDGYIDEYLIEQNSYQFPQDIEEVMKNKINNYLFELFKDSVTVKYLENHGHISG